MITQHNLVQVLWSISWASSPTLTTTSHPNVDIQRGPHQTFRIRKKSVVQTEPEAQHISVWSTEWALLSKDQGQKGCHYRISPHHSSCWRFLWSAETHIWNSEKEPKFKCLMKWELCRKAGSPKISCSLFISKWPAATGWPGTSCYLTSSATTLQ